VGFGKCIKYERLQVLGNSNAGIIYCNQNHLIFFLDSGRDYAVVGGELDAVGKQVADSMNKFTFLYIRKNP
jgi:hypothetical protein